MQIEFDPDKNARNIRERGLDFSLVACFDFESAIYQVDDRRDYGELRIRALGLISNRVHALVFVEIENGFRIISFRKANKREVRNYETST